MTEKKHSHEEHDTPVLGRGLKADKAEAKAEEAKAKEIHETTPDEAARAVKGDLHPLADRLVSCQNTQEQALVAIHADAQAILDADKKPEQVDASVAHLRLIHDSLFALHQAVAAAGELLTAAETALKDSLVLPK